MSRESRRDGVPPEGPDVFRAQSDEPRTAHYIGGCISLAGEPCWLRYRWPSFVDHLPALPVRTTVILMSERSLSQRPLARDPYGTLPIEPGADPEKGVA